MMSIYESIAEEARRKLWEENIEGEAGRVATRGITSHLDEDLKLLIPPPRDSLDLVG